MNATVVIGLILGVVAYNASHLGEPTLLGSFGAVAIHGADNAKNAARVLNDRRINLAIVGAVR